MNAPLSTLSPEPRLTSLSHGGGCGCKIAPGVLSEILKGTARMPIPKELLVGIETADDAAVYQLNDEQALIATTDFFMPIVDDPYDFGRIAATNAISDVYAMGGQPIMALALVGMPISVLSTQTIGKILEGGESVCREAGIPIAGGHTIDSVEPIYGLVALGLVHPKRVKRNADARAGDVLVLGKPLGVGVLSAALKKEKLEPAGYRRMIETTTKLNTPGPELAAHLFAHRRVAYAFLALRRRQREGGAKARDLVEQKRVVEREVGALAVGGEQGVVEVLRNLLADVELTLGLTGCRSFAEVGRESLVEEGPVSTPATHPKRSGGA